MKSLFKLLQKSKIAWVLILFIIGFGIRYYLSFFHDGVIVDAEVYLDASKAIFNPSISYSDQPMWQGGKFIAQPLYPIFIAVFNLFISDTLLAAQMVSIIVGSLTILIIFWVAKAFFNETIGLIAAFITAIYGNLILYSLNILTESLFIFISLFVIIFLYKSLIRNSLFLFFITGLTIGLGFLCRSFGLIYLFVTIFIMITSIVFLHTRIKRLLMHFLFLFAGFLFITIPYFIYLRTELGEWSLGHQFYMAKKDYEEAFEQKSIYRKGVSEAERVSYSPKDHSSVYSFMISELIHGYFIQLYYIMRKGTGILTIFPLVFIIFIVLGIIYNKNDNSKIVNLILIAFLFSFPLFLPLLKPISRYLSPIIPFGIMYIASAVFYLSKNFIIHFHTSRIKIFQKQWLWTSILLLFILIINLPIFVDPIQKKSKLPKNYAYIGEWLKSQSPGRDRILSNKYFIPIYSDDDWFLPKKNIDSFEDIVNIAKNDNVKFLVVVDGIISEIPNIQTIVMKDYDSQKLFLIKEFYEPTNVKIYQFIF